MAVKYTNRKGRTYFLCRGVTKAGKARYFFSPRAEGNLVEEIPEGYKISESPNSVVSLVKSQPPILREIEVLAVKNALQKHPRTRLYRMDVKGARITVHELADAVPQDLIQRLAGQTGLSGSLAAQFEADYLARGKFAPVMRFTLTDPEKRRFKAERMCYLGSIDDWIDIAFDKSILELARTLIPVLGSEKFFDLH